MRIIQVVNALDYGGVETYVIRLSRALHELGHDSIIVSHGGVLELLAKRQGVEVVKLSPGKRGVEEAARELQGRGFDVLNAHNYNSGRIGIDIARKIGVPYVLTVHGPRPFLKRLLYPCWSKYVITASRENTREITGWGGRRPETVFTTFLPPDVEQYQPRVVPESVRQDFISGPSEKLVLHVSRFSNRKTKVAMALLDAVPEIIRLEPDARFVIIGAGPEFGLVADRVEEVRAQVGPVARMAEARVDLSEAFNAASVVIATATTAGEALACGVPVIAAGRTGYLGPINVSRLQEGLDYMFADHGKCPREVEPHTLTTDILDVLANEDTWRSEAMAVSAIIAERLRPIDAAREVLRVYERVMTEGGR